MPYFHCRKCHHEFEAVGPTRCAWCGADDPRTLEEATSFEALLADIKRAGGFDRWMKVRTLC